jgi:hypothetical protein
MPYKALSECVKCQKQRKHNDALKEWTAECNKLQKEGL